MDHFVQVVLMDEDNTRVWPEHMAREAQGTLSRERQRAMEQHAAQGRNALPTKEG
jgi:hypothetical protein